MTRNQLFIHQQHATRKTSAQSLILDFIESLKIQIIHNGFALKGDTRLLIPTKEDLSIANYLQFEQKGGLIQNHYVDAFRFQALRELTEKVELVVEKLVRLDLLHQQNGNIDIC